MDQKVIEELEIIIRAKAEDARSELQKVAKQTKETANTIAKEMNKINKNGQLLNLKKELQNTKDEMRELWTDANEKGKEVLIKCKADMSDFTDKMAEAESKIQDLREESESIEISTTVSTSGDMPSSPSSQKIEIDTDTSKAEKKVSKLKSDIKTLIPKKEDLTSFSLLSVQEQVKIIVKEIRQVAPIIDTFIGSAKNAVEEFSSLNDSCRDFVEGLKNVPPEAVFVAKSIQEKFQSAFSTIKKSASKLVPNNLDKWGSIFSKIKVTGNQAFLDIKNKINNLLSPIQSFSELLKKPIGTVKQLISHLKNAKKTTDDTKKAGSNFGKNFGKSIESGIKSIKRFALSLLSVRSAFSLVSKAAQAYLSFDSQLSSSIQNSWNMLGSLLAPVLELVANLFSKLTNSVASFVKQLTGIDLVARANAKSLQNQEKATKKLSSANKSLSGIDDIDTLSSSKGDSEEAPQIEVTPVDIKPLENVFKKLQVLFSDLFRPLQEAWDSVGAGVFQSLSDMLTGIGDLCSTVFDSFLEVWTNGTGTEIVTNVLLGFQNLFDIIGAVAGAFSNAWVNAGTGTNIVQSIADIINNILKYCNDIGNSIKKWVMSEGFQEALNAVLGFVEDILDIGKQISDWLLEMYEKYVQPVLEESVLPCIDSVVTAIGAIWEACEPVVKKCIGIIENTLEPVIKGLSGVIGGITKTIKGIADFVSGVFKGDWEKAWNGIKEFFGGIWDAIGSIVKTPINLILSAVESLVNALIDGFNSFKKAINKISFDVPDWIPVIGGQKWGFNLKLSDSIKLPRLKYGDVAYEETHAVIGEYANARQDPEIVSPVSMMAETFRNVLSEKEEGGTKVERLVLNVLGENFFDEAIDYINNESMRKGVSVIKEVG